MTKQTILALLLVFSIYPPLVAQSPVPAASPVQTPTPTPAEASPTPDDKDDVVRITTNLVQVDAVVTKNGKPVRDLKGEDFEIFEDGHRQQITTFAYISNVLEPGNYYLQLVVTDRTQKEEQGSVVQWIDFEIVK